MQQSTSIWNTYHIQRHPLQLNTKYSWLSWKIIRMSYSCIALLLKKYVLLMNSEAWMGNYYCWNAAHDLTKLILYYLFQYRRCCVMVCGWRNRRNSPQNIYIHLSACSKGLLLDVESYSLLFALLYHGQKHSMATYNLR